MPKAFTPCYSDPFGELFATYKQRIEQAIELSIEGLGEKTALRDACEYVLKNGGKRFRPALVYMIAAALGAVNEVADAAIAIEYLHTASLIVDDLPCMDNDALRRGKPTLHETHDETVALMASYALIAAGYGCIAKNSLSLAASSAHHASRADEICRLALENVAYNSGLCGATGGQFLDLYPQNFDFHSVESVIRKKTASLFEISFVLGWLFGGGGIDLLPQVKQASYHFGMAFQIADDITDRQMDILSGRKINMAICVGPEKATEMCHQHIKECKTLLENLSIGTSELFAVLTHLESTLPAVPYIEKFIEGKNLC